MEQFDINKFKSINNFSQRLKYAGNHLQKLGTGSSRVAYDLGDGKVLKLAKNAKGIAQNETEANMMEEVESIIARVLDHDDAFLYVIMEKAEKMRPSDFKKFFGYSVHTVDMFLNNHHANSRGRRTFWSLPAGANDDLYDNEYISEVIALSDNFGIVITDFGRPANWGIVTRGGQQVPVLIDYGFDEKTASTHYGLKLEVIKRRYKEEGNGLTIREWMRGKWGDRVNFSR